MKKFLKGFLIFFGLSSLLIGAGMMAAQASGVTLGVFSVSNIEDITKCQDEVVESVPGYKKCLTWQNTCMDKVEPEDGVAVIACRQATERCMDHSIDSLSSSRFDALEAEMVRCTKPYKNRS